MVTQHSAEFNSIVDHAQNMLLDDPIISGAARSYALKTLQISSDDEELNKEDSATYCRYYELISQYYLTLLATVASKQVCINIP